MIAALKASRIVPAGHIMVPARVNPRRDVICIRQDICDIAVKAFHSSLTATAATESAIFSGFDAVAQPAPGGVAAAAAAPVTVNEESTKERFLVRSWISYDIRDLSADAPNALLRARLTLQEQNDETMAVDLAIGHELKVEKTVITGLGISPVNRKLREHYASKVFQRVTPKPAVSIREIEKLCQPLWAFPVLSDVATASAFFKEKTSKWDASQWLILPKLY
jgi:hypothetical protein